MKSKVIILFTVFFSFFLWGQKTRIEFIEKKDSLEKKEKRDFIFLHSDVNLNTARYLAKILGNGRIVSLNVLLADIQRKSQKIGANAFRYVSSKVVSDSFEIILELYKIEDDIKIENKRFYPINSIYIFGKNNFNKQTEEKYKLNKEEKIIKSGEYDIIPVDEGEKVSINKGGAMGMTYNYKVKGQIPSLFINFSGFGISGPAPYGLGLSFSAGKIYEMNIDYGLLLLEIYKKNSNL